MINQVPNLETCWYLSPPWGKEISPLRSFPVGESLRHYHQIFRLLLRCRVVS
ncbi:DUF1392 family protein [Nostoc sp. 'Peltigera membranacea cyanobiont' 232]|uniref:DUF1392 family protein n=1 Tax=Nostoc sp. 'Peltigera membranacea cyanobiont' 232 TaxID=2014531 RepID=UPI003FA5DA57